METKKNRRRKPVKKVQRITLGSRTDMSMPSQVSLLITVPGGQKDGK